jgi:hypothetical protein
MIVGYARVSTDGQTLDAQRAALAQAGAHQVFAEKSGAAAVITSPDEAFAVLFEAHRSLFGLGVGAGGAFILLGRCGHSCHPHSDWAARKRGEDQ